MADKPREATFTPTALFEKTFRAHADNNADVEERFKDFVKSKKERPPGKYNREHKLNPPFKGISECHLAGNSCLLFSDKGDVVTLYCVATHDEMKGKRGKRLAKKIG